MKKVTKLFNQLADEGKAITDYREHHFRLYELPAKRIELILKLRKLKEQFFTTIN